jgi:hypothetical protein
MMIFTTINTLGQLICAFAVGAKKKKVISSCLQEDWYLASVESAWQLLKVVSLVNGLKTKSLHLLLELF